MEYKIIVVILMTMLMLVSVFAGATTIKIDTTTKTEKNMDLYEGMNPLGERTLVGYGGWHDPQTQGFNGSDFTNISGDWEYWGSYSIEQSPNDGDDAWCKARYFFTGANGIGDTCVKYLLTMLKYKCYSAFGDGPQIELYDWDANDWWISDNLGRYSNWVVGWVYKNGSEVNKYINDNGELDVIIYAWDSDDFWSGDDFVNNWVLIEFQTADEEIYLAQYSTRDDNGDGSPDGVDIAIDVDVGEPDYNTTVEVTAHCELVDPNENVVDEITTTWTITDWQIDPENVTLSAMGGPIGEYTMKIWLFDEFGNQEDYVEGPVDLSPPYAVICSEDSLVWNNIAPEATVTDSFTIENVGGQGSLLDWKVISWPEWGTWTFTPESGLNLPSEQSATVEVEVVAPNEKRSTFEGEIKVINTEDPDNYCIIPISLQTPRNRVLINPLAYQLIQRFQDNFPIFFKILNHFINF